MEDGSTSPSGGARSATREPTPQNRRQAVLILLTMVVFFVGLVALSCWAASNG
jgi:hypothetical protein